VGALLRLSLAAALLVSACGGGAGGPDDDAARLASGEPVPTSCVPAKVGRASTVAFVANGSAWALNPRTGLLACLFPAAHPGLFEWGPRADRALLAGLEVRSLDGGPSRPPGNVDPAVASWGRPIGKSIVFVSADGHALLKAHPAGGPLQDVTPVPNADYKLVVYHPSGLAFAFVLMRKGRESIWISSNVGAKPRMLVHGRLHTGFEALAFDAVGQTLYFVGRHRGGEIHVHSLPLVGATSAPIEWQGRPGDHVTDVLPGWAGFALTVGPDACASRRAVIVTTKRAGVAALAGDRPSRAVGWLDDTHLLVAAGGCGSPLDLYSVEHATLQASLLVRNVDAASVRRAEALPPPPLPLAKGRGSFA
jgi:hypothetical protein